MMEVRQIMINECDAVKGLVLEVFMQYEAPTYGPQGVETFKRTGIEDENYMASLTIYGAFVENQLVGVIATRNRGMHIELFFVKGSYHRQGIGKALFERVEQEGMTVNSSPYAQKVYEHLGFMQTASQQTVEGIRFIPMKLVQ